jgi:hypothetical protein
MNRHRSGAPFPPVPRLRQVIEESRHSDIENGREEVGSKSQPAVKGENEDARQYGEQVIGNDNLGPMAGSPPTIWCIISAVLMFVSPSARIRVQSSRIRSAPDFGAAAPLRRDMPQRMPGRATDSGCSGTSRE